MTERFEGPVGGSSDSSPKKIDHEDDQLIIREFKKSDRDGLLQLCLSHYKGLALPSVKYYCENHYVEIIVLMIMGICQTSVFNVLLNFCIFAIYLYARAWFELREYCRVNCTDLEDVEGFYMTKSDANFFIAEMRGKVVGCGGIRKSRFHDPKDGQIMRLVVDPNHRRLRIGSRLLSQMEMFSHEYGYERMFLNTSNLTKAHIRFVKVNGFRMTACIPRNCMRGDLLKWRKILTPASQVSPLIDVDEQNVC